MDIDTRIRRRRRRGASQALVLDYDRLNPAAHVAEPIGRGPIVERVLDHLDPAFDGSLPSDVYVWGPPGSGKSAVLTAVFSRLETPATQPQTAIQTTTRAQSVELPQFVYVNGREVDSEFQLYRRVLDGLTDADAPTRGISTDELTSRLRSALAEPVGTVIAVDHAEEFEFSPAAVRSSLEALDGTLSTVLVGRTPPSDVDEVGDVAEIEIPGYGQQVLIDVLMTRGSSGLAQDALAYDQTRRIAAWAGGNAHDALAALFSAAVIADDDGVQEIRDDDVAAGIDAVPRDGTSLGVVLALPSNRQRVLRAFLELDDDRRSSVTTTTEAIADSKWVDLSVGTVKRILYELADAGVFDRVTAEQTTGHGRPPSRLEPQFPTLVFRELYDIQSAS
ncbi:CDC6 protein [Halorhabdus tiamatea SARL4B]|uniref:CDC6 protein n=1 Tax=Halorhabdus tiamatea SARL4B TaxID=1033806 RepID=F7PNS2_9EURY|nr:AAA family ATPase [Halorhabdus tiamatea]ERJ06769.1 CDC6 protein [Halorhabdus tiamatea SARL4B]CCQ33692.1 cell division control protein 6-like protein [Halorhabdus tiamatea SARL4B]